MIRWAVWAEQLWGWFRFRFGFGGTLARWNLSALDVTRGHAGLREHITSSVVSLSACSFKRIKDERQGRCRFVSSVAWSWEVLA
jgi:hypothetical protein